MMYAFQWFFVLQTIIIIDPISAGTINLNGNWTLSSENVTHVVGNVPGGIYSDLRNGYILKENPLYRFNDINYRWIGNQTWTYHKEFTVPQGMLNESKIILNCEGIDTVSKITINNKDVGSTINMFVRYNFDIKDALKPGTNRIQIVFTSPMKYAKDEYNSYLWEKHSVPPMRRPPKEHGECHMNFIRKMQCSFGWDWGPAFPSVGIWKPISIQSYSGIKLEDVTVHTSPVSAQTNTNDVWDIKLSLFIKKADKELQTAKIKVDLDTLTIYQQNVELQTDDQPVTLTMSTPKDFHIKKWWPNGFGDQNLYDLKIVIIEEATQEVINRTKRIGFRTIELIQDKVENERRLKGLMFYFKVNGFPIFAKGSNWIPASIFPEKSTDDMVYDLLLSTKYANMNMLRVWGGGVYESDFFYDTADEMGILIWHDFMFACAMYQTGDPFLETVSTEVRQQVRRLQHHPSIALWAGNNENEAALAQNWYATAVKFDMFKEEYVKLYVDTIMPIVLKEDPGRTYLSSSPTNGLKTEEEGWVAKKPGDIHYGDVHFYDYFNDLWSFEVYPRARFVSEYGYQSWPSFETIERVSSPDDWNWSSKFTKHRQHLSTGAQSINSQLYLHFDRLKSSNSTKLFINKLYLSQISQAMSIKTQTETYRRRMTQLDASGAGKTMGALYWQLNDVWQAPSWSSIEHGGKWKMLHYFARNFFTPCLISPYIEAETLHVYAILDEPDLPQHFNLKVSVYSWKNLQPAYSRNMNFSMAQFTAQEVFTAPIENLLKSANIDDSHDCFFYFNMTDAKTGISVSTNFIFSSHPKNHSRYLRSIDLQRPNIQVRSITPSCYFGVEQLKSFDIQLTTDEIALFVWLEVFGVKGWFSDNGFVMVEPKKVVRFHTTNPNVTDEIISEMLNVNSLNDVYLDDTL